MTEWFYKATPTKVSYEETRDLAVNEGFICRSAYEENGSLADNAHQVDLQDIIHLYFSDEGKYRPIGSFRVIGPKNHPHPERFTKIAQGTKSLFEIQDDYATTLSQLGEPGAERYKQDPVLKKLVGWALVKLDIETPLPAPDSIKNQATLVRR